MQLDEFTVVAQGFDGLYRRSCVGDRFRSLVSSITLKEELDMATKVMTYHETVRNLENMVDYARDGGLPITKSEQDTLANALTMLKGVGLALGAVK